MIYSHKLYFRPDVTRMIQLSTMIGMEHAAHAEVK